MKRILFALKRDVTLMRRPVSGGETTCARIKRKVSGAGVVTSRDRARARLCAANRNGILFGLVKKILVEIAGGNGAISAKTGDQRESVWQQNWTTLPAPRRQSRTGQIEALFTVYTLRHIYGRVQHGKRTYPAWKENKKWEFVAADNRVYRML